MNDYLLNYLENPEFTPSDFSEVGLNSGNTTIQPKSAYEGYEVIQNSSILQTEGKYDSNKFNEAYKNALLGYNDLTQKDHNKDVSQSVSYFRDNLFVPEEKRRKGPDFIVTKVANPLRQTTGFQTFNVREESDWTMREIGETNKVYDPVTGKFLEETPNDRGFFKNIYDPLVLATWDYDADEFGRRTSDSSKVYYKKGSMKLNEDGEPYYEKLGGRSIYGKQVLSATDTLTIDGSAWNKFDFFDSDDKDKSTFGTLLKNAVKVVPAFIPGVNTWYLGARVLLNIADLSAKTGKIFLGDDVPVLNLVEGISKSTDFSSSDYAVEHVWSAENILNLSADVFTQLAEQRWIFEKIPKMMGEKPIATIEERKNFIAEAENKRYGELLNRLKGNPSTIKEAMEAEAAVVSGAQRELLEYSSGVSKLAEHLSKVYMTGITVADSFAEAKLAGLSDLEAGLFILSYALGEYALLNTGVGEHILPELRIEKAMWKKLANILAYEKRPDIKAPKQEKLTWIKRIMGAGHQAATGEVKFPGKVANAIKELYSGKFIEESMGVGIAKAAFAHAIGEGIEETSEELLLDFAKSLFNAAAWLTGSESRMEAWDNIIDRYGMSFVGGLIGGGLGTGLTRDTFRQYQDLAQMDKTQAFQQLVHLVKEGDGQKFLKFIDKLPLGNKYLSFNGEGEVVETPEGPTYAFQPGTTKDNMDLTYKTLFKDYVNIIDKILTEEGAKVSDDSLINGFVQDLKLAKLASSNLAGSYLQDWNSLISEITKIKLQINGLKTGSSDSADEKKEEKNKEQISELESQLKKLREKKEAYFDGTIGKQFIKQALFEMQDSISRHWISTNFINYAETIENKPIEKIPKERVEQLKKAWEDIVGGNASDRIREIADVFILKNASISDILKQSQDKYFTEGSIFDKISKQFVQKLQELNISAATGAITGEEFLKEAEQLSANKANEVLASALTEVIENEGGILPDDNLALIDIQSLSDLSEDEVEKQAQIANLLDIYDAVFNPNGNYDKKLVLTDEDLKQLREKRLDLYLKQIISDNSFLLQWVISQAIYTSEEAKDLLGKYLYKIAEGNQEALDMLRKVKAKSEELPIEELLDYYSLGINGEKISDLLVTLRSLALNLSTNNDIQSFSYGNNIQEQINYAHQVIKLLESHILAARTDEAGLQNLWGFNHILNNMENTDLAELTKSQANTLIFYLHKYDSLLTFYENIYKVNQGQKLAEQFKIGAKTHTLFIKQLKVIVDSFNDDEKYKELKEAINSADLTNSLIQSLDNENAFNLLEDDQVKLEKERFVIEQAMHNLFVRDDFDIHDVVNPNLYNVIRPNEEILNIETQEISPQNFISWLAFTAAVEPKSFYNSYVKSIRDEFAAIPGQEFAIKMALAFILNPKMFRKFGDAYNEVALDNIQKANEDDLKAFSSVGSLAVSKDYPIDSDVYLKYLSTFLVEGIAGSGKSTAVFNYILNIIRNSEFKDKLLKNIWIVHGVTESENIDTESEEYKNAINAGFSDADLRNCWKAYLLGLSLGFTAKELVGKCFSRTTYLKKITDNQYVDWTTDSKGDVVYDNNNIKINSEDNCRVYKWDVSESSEVPSFIIIDEVSRFSPQDMELSERFQAKKGSMAIAAGDYSQLGSQGLYSENNSTRRELLKNHRNNFFTSPKLGSALRPNNNLQNYSNNIIRSTIYNTEAIRNILDGQELDTESVEYSELEDGLFGVKISKESSDDSANESWKNTIQLMINTLNPGEKIRVIISKEEESKAGNKVIEFINNLPESDKSKIEFTKNGSAQGGEGQYYIAIVPLTLEDDSDGFDISNYLKTLYTATSRASQGTLLFTGEALLDSKEGILIRSELGKDAIIQYNEKRKKVLNAALGDYNVGLTLKNEVVPVPPKKPESATEDEIIPDEVPLSGTGQDEKFTEENNVPFLSPIENTSDKEYNMLVHTMPSNETGLIFDEESKKLRRVVASDKLGDSKQEELRIDSLHGIVKVVQNLQFDTNGFIVDSSGNDQEARAKEILEKVRNLGYTIKSRKELVQLIAKALGLEGEKIGVDFAFKSTFHKDAENTKSQNYFSRFLKRGIERILNIWNASSDKQLTVQRRNKTIDMIIYKEVDNKRISIVDIPLAQFTSPITMLKTKDFINTDLYKEYIKEYNKTRDTYTSLIHVQDYILRKPEASRTYLDNLMYKHIQVYILNSDTCVYFDNLMGEDDTLVSISKASTGMFTSFHERGTNKTYEEDGYIYLGEWQPLSVVRNTPGNIVTDRIYTSPNDVLYDNREVAIRKGHPFILISKDPRYYRSDKDEAMFRDYINWTKNPIGICPVSRIYISTPKVSIDRYVSNFLKIFEKDESPNKSYGNMFSTYRILQKITREGSAFETYIKNLNATQEKVDGGQESKGENRDLRIFWGQPMARYYKSLQDGVLAIERYVRDRVENYGENELEVLDDIWRNKTLSNLANAKDPKLKDIFEAMVKPLAEHTGKLIYNYAIKVGVKQFFQQNLYRILCQEYDINGTRVESTSIETESYPEYAKKIAAIKEDVKSWKTEEEDEPGIYYNLQLDGTYEIAVEDNRFVANREDTFLPDEQVKINGKLDSPAFLMNVLPMMDLILWQMTDMKEYSEGIYGMIQQNPGFPPTKMQKDFARFTNEFGVTVGVKINNLVVQEAFKDNKELLTFLNGLPDTNYQDIIRKAIEKKRVLLQIDDSDPFNPPKINGFLELNNGERDVVIDFQNPPHYIVTNKEGDTPPVVQVDMRNLGNRIEYVGEGTDTEGGTEGSTEGNTGGSTEFNTLQEFLDNNIGVFEIHYATGTEVLTKENLDDVKTTLLGCMDVEDIMDASNLSKDAAEQLLKLINKEGENGCNM